MKYKLNESNYVLTRVIKLLPLASGVAVMLFGGVVLASWMLGGATLSGFPLDRLAVMPNTALSFILAGLSLCLHQRSDASRVRNRVSQLCGATVAVIGAVTLGQYLTGWSLGVNDLFLPAQLSAISSPHSLRMSPNSAVCFVLTGAALVCLNAVGARAGVIAERLAIVSGFIAVTALAGHIYGAREFIGFFSLTGMAMSSVVAFLVLNSGLLAARGENSLVMILVSQGPEGILARMAFGCASLLLLLGWVTEQWHRAGHFGPQPSAALLMTAGLAVFTILAWGGICAVVQLEKARRRSEARAVRQQQLIDQSLEPTLTWDLDSGIVEWNLGCELLYGFSRKEALGQSTNQLLRTVYPAPFDKIKAKLLAEGIWSGELQHTTKDGRRLIVRSSQQLTETDGRRLVLETNHDVTERKLAEQAMRESEERFAKAFQASPHLMTISTLDDGRYLAVNDAVLRATGYAREEMVGHTSTELKIFDHPEGRERLVRAFTETGLVRDLEMNLRGKDGSVRTVLVSAEIITLDGRRCVLTTSLDVHERRRAEADSRFLAEIGERIQFAGDAEDLLRDVSQRVGEYLQVRRCFISEVDLASDRGLIRRDYCRGVPSVAGEYKLSDYAPETRGELEAGRTVINYDSQADPRTAAAYDSVYGPAGERAYVGVPLLRDEQLVGIFCVSADEPRQWQGPEIRLLETVAERMWLAVEKLRLDAALRESEARLRLAQESGGVGIWDWNAVTDLTYWSDTMWALYGLGPQPMKPAEGFWESHLHPEDRERVMTEIARFLASAECEYRDEFRILRPDGELRWVEAVARLKRDAAGAPLRLSGVNIDITARKMIEKQREQLLEDERRLRAIAEAHNRAKDEFLSVVSHELRSPLNAILGYARVARLTAQDAEEVIKSCEIIERNAKSQQQLIEDLLDTARIISGKLRLEVSPTDLRLVLEEALEVARPAAEAKKIGLVTRLGDGVPQMIADASRLQQVAWNLLQNAIKFTPEGGRVELRLQNLGEHVQIVVSDTGVGIEPEFLTSVFDRFTQQDASLTRRHGGLGLGLALVKQLVEMHGGNIEAFSEGAGRGATFTVTLPVQQPITLIPYQLPETLSRAALAVGALRLDKAPLLEGVSVLAVDDEEDSLLLLARTLSGFGAQVTAISMGTEALEFLSHPQNDRWPDVLVLDIAMPDVDGYTLLQKIRALEAERGTSTSGGVPAIAVTAFGRSEDRLRALAAGFRTHVPKPVEPAELAFVIASVMNTNGKKHKS